MRSRNLTLLMPAMRPSDCVRHWPVALLLAVSGHALVQRRVDARLARAKYLANAYASSGGRCFSGAPD